MIGPIRGTVPVIGPVSAVRHCRVAAPDNPKQDFACPVSDACPSSVRHLALPGTVPAAEPGDSQTVLPLTLIIFGMLKQPSLNEMVVID
ncbi:MAG: hypothetical protein WBI44_04725 [Syntrophaceticus sp.]